MLGSNSFTNRLDIRKFAALSIYGIHLQTAALTVHYTVNGVK